MTARRGKNAYDRIRAGMRRKEVELLAHLRTHRVFNLALMGSAWMRALRRLEEAKQVRWSRAKGCYVLRHGARPVTKEAQ